MKRVRMSIGILCILIIISTLTELWITRRCRALVDEISAVSECYDSGERESAEAAAEKLSRKWDDFRKSAAFLVKNDRLSEIDRINSRIIYLIKSNNDELQSDLSELRHMIENLEKSETPLLISVF